MKGKVSRYKGILGYSDDGSSALHSSSPSERLIGPSIILKTPLIIFAAWFVSELSSEWFCTCLCWLCTLPATKSHPELITCDEVQPDNKTTIINKNTLAKIIPLICMNSDRAITLPVNYAKQCKKLYSATTYFLGNLILEMMSVVFNFCFSHY